MTDHPQDSLKGCAEYLRSLDISGYSGPYYDRLRRWADAVERIAGDEPPSEAMEVLRELVTATDAYDAIPCPNWVTHDAVIAKARAARCESAMARRMAAWDRAREIVSRSPQEGGWLLPDDMAALQRFWETTEDAQEYDVPKPRMKRLTEIGVVQWCGGSRYGMTAFGQHVLDLLPDGWPRRPLKTHADHDKDVNAAIDESSGFCRSPSPVDQRGGE